MPQLDSPYQDRYQKGCCSKKGQEKDVSQCSKEGNKWMQDLCQERAHKQKDGQYCDYRVRWYRFQWPSHDASMPDIPLASMYSDFELQVGLSVGLAKYPEKNTGQFN